MSIRSSSQRRSSVRKLPTIALADPFIDRILAEDRDYLNVLNIRDELIENALDQCYDSYIRQQSVKFVVDCMHKAYLEMMNTVFCHYDNGIVASEEERWRIEPEFAPLACDNYAEFTVPFGASEMDNVEDEVSQPIRDTEEMPWMVDSRRATVEVDQEEESKVVPYESLSMYETATEVSQREEAHFSLATETTELFEEISSETSFFTAVAEAEQNLLPPIESLRCEITPVKSSEMPADKTSRFVIECRTDLTGVLPPLRLKGKFKAHDPKMPGKFGKSLSEARVQSTEVVQRNSTTKD